MLRGRLDLEFNELVRYDRTWTTGVTGPVRKDKTETEGGNEPSEGLTYKCRVKELNQSLP